MTGWIIIMALAIGMAVMAAWIIHPIYKENRDIPWPIMIYFILILPVGGLVIYLWLGRPVIIGLF